MDFDKSETNGSSKISCKLTIPDQSPFMTRDPINFPINDYFCYCILTNWGVHISLGHNEMIFIFIKMIDFILTDPSKNPF